MKDRERDGGGGMCNILYIAIFSALCLAAFMHLKIERGISKGGGRESISKTSPTWYMADMEHAARKVLLTHTQMHTKTKSIYPSTNVKHIKYHIAFLSWRADSISRFWSKKMSAYVGGSRILLAFKDLRVRVTKNIIVLRSTANCEPYCRNFVAATLCMKYTSRWSLLEMGGNGET